MFMSSVCVRTSDVDGWVIDLLQSSTKSVQDDICSSSSPLLPRLTFFLALTYKKGVCQHINFSYFLPLLSHIPFLFSCHPLTSSPLFSLSASWAIVAASSSLLLPSAAYKQITTFRLLLRSFQALTLSIILSLI